MARPRGTEWRDGFVVRRLREDTRLSVGATIGGMTQRSDIGRLFRRRALGCQEPIENYTSESLAIAIERDDATMREALHSIVWPTSKPKPFDPAKIAGIVPRTQVYLP